MNMMTEENRNPQAEQSQVSQPPPVPQEPIYQGQPQTGGYSQQPYSRGYISPQDLPNNYMVLSIIATAVGFLLCCSNCCIAGILGIVAIVYSNQVHPKYTMGDYLGASSSASTAKLLAIISLILSGLSLLGGVLSFIGSILKSGGINSILENQMRILEQFN